MVTKSVINEVMERLGAERDMAPDADIRQWLATLSPRMAGHVLELAIGAMLLRDGEKVGWFDIESAAGIEVVKTETLLLN